MSTAMMSAPSFVPLLSRRRGPATPRGAGDEGDLAFGTFQGILLMPFSMHRFSQPA